MTGLPIAENGRDNHMSGSFFASPWDGFRLFTSGAINKNPLISNISKGNFAYL